MMLSFLRIVPANHSTKVQNDTTAKTRTKGTTRKPEEEAQRRNKQNVKGTQEAGCSNKEKEQGRRHEHHQQQESCGCHFKQERVQRPSSLYDRHDHQQQDNEEEQELPQYDQRHHKKQDEILVLREVGGDDQHITISRGSASSRHYRISSDSKVGTTSSAYSSINFSPLSLSSSILSRHASITSSTTAAVDTVSSFPLSFSSFSCRNIAGAVSAGTTTPAMMIPSYSSRQPLFIFSLINDHNWRALRKYLLHLLLSTKNSSSSPQYLSSASASLYITQESSKKKQLGTRIRDVVAATAGQLQGGPPRQSLCQERDEKNLTCLALALAHKAPLDIIKMMIKVDPSLPHICDDYGATALHVGCLNGITLESLDYILRKYEDQVKQLDIDRRTPLHHAVEHACSFYIDDDNDDSSSSSSLLTSSCFSSVQEKNRRRTSFEVLIKLCQVAPQMAHVQDNMNLTPVDLVHLNKVEEKIDHKSEEYGELECIYQVLKNASIVTYKERKRLWEEAGSLMMLSDLHRKTQRQEQEQQKEQQQQQQQQEVVVEMKQLEGQQQEILLAMQQDHHDVTRSRNRKTRRIGYYA